MWNLTTFGNKYRLAKTFCDSYSWLKLVKTISWYDNIVWGAKFELINNLVKLLFKINRPIINSMSLFYCMLIIWKLIDLILGLHSWDMLCFWSFILPSSHFIFILITLYSSVQQQAYPKNKLIVCNLCIIIYKIQTITCLYILTCVLSFSVPITYSTSFCT